MTFGQETWLLEQEHLNARHGTLAVPDERPNPTALVLNLTPIPVVNALAAIEAAGDGGKEHPGVRATFVILRMLSPGWSSAPSADDAGAGGKRRFGKQSSAPKEKYGSMVDGHVLLHSYDLLNKKGTYSKGTRAESFVCLSPGMVISTKVFGNKMNYVFSGKADLGGFQLALAQFDSRSTSSTAVESGNMLDIKSLAPLPNYILSSPRLLPAGLLPSTIAAGTARREAFLSGEVVPEGHREGCRMDMMRGALSMSYSVVDLGLLAPSAGLFAVSPDGHLRFHATLALSDVPAPAVEVTVDPRAHGTSDNGWLARMLNTVMRLGAVRMIIGYDSYRNKSIQPPDQKCEGYAHVDVPRLASAIFEGRAASPVAGDADVAAVFNGAKTPLEHLQLYAGCATGIDVVVDTRAMTSTGKPVPMTSIAHPTESSWQAAHMLTIFQNKVPVLAFVVPTGSCAVSLESTTSALTAIGLPDLADCYHHVQEEEDIQLTQRPSKKTKRSD